MKTLTEIKQEINKLLEDNNCFLTTIYNISEDNNYIQLVRAGTKGKEIIDI